MSDPVCVVVLGVTGRMGRQIASCALDDDRFTLGGATVRPGAHGAGDDVGGLVGTGPIGVVVGTDLDAVLGDLAGKSPVVIDFTAASALEEHLAVCVKHRAPLVVGTTGLSTNAHAAVDKAAENIAILQAANTSLGANLLGALTERASAALHAAGAETDIEIVELHHNQKKDSPSGTALMLADRAAAGRKVNAADVVTTARAGMQPREDGEIGVFGVRGADVPGEHTVYLFLNGERLELTHRVLSRRIFATGALAAARFVDDKKVGRYEMADVLGVS